MTEISCRYHEKGNPTKPVKIDRKEEKRKIENKRAEQSEKLLPMPQEVDSLLAT